jgi:two-component system sensor histidine kinase KdpD
MRKVLAILGKIALASAVVWLSAEVCVWLGANRSTGSMVLLLVVLGVAARGERILALATSVSASLAFSWFFVDRVGSLMITSLEGGVTFSMMLITAFTGSQLSVRALNRASEAIRRREEMERLQEFGNSLFASETVALAAASAVELVVKLFGAAGASLTLAESGLAWSSGLCERAPSTSIRVGMGELELFGGALSVELSNAVGNLVRLVLERARSVEDRARMEASQRGEELRNVVLNALAHNFKTPLTSIKAAASVLRSNEAVLGVDARELIAVIDEEADRLNQLIRESLDLARIEAHQASPRFEDCSLADVAKSVTSRLARYVGGRALSVEVPEFLPPVRGDRFLLEQMLMQVVDNAWKYSKPGSAIRIGGETLGSTVILSVENEGCEIPVDEREKLFTKFYRGSGSGSQVEGTGLGLAISQAIAEAHGGKVWLEMMPNGPAFRFSLPAGSVPAESAPGEIA